MKFDYYKETDTLYIELSEKAGADAQEIHPGIVLDYDETGNLVGIEIDKASNTIDFSKLEIISLPFSVFSVNQERKVS